ncbi:MAG: hypothetical protein E7591_03100 [Ruminococcaceae bacterium]|nr:hypothetical protein [Oscillospiraceae bacterium]
MKRLVSLLSMVLVFAMLLPAAAMADNEIPPEKESSEMKEEALTASTKPLLVAYYNASQVVSYEFSGIDVLNYHPATVVANAMTNPSSGSIITHSYSSKMASIRSTARAQNPNIKFVFTVANGNINDFESWFYNKTHAEKLASEMVSIITKYGFDGLDIDYEFPSDSNNMKTNFVYFMQRMREKFDALSASNGKEYILSMAVPGTHWAFSLFKMNELANYVDYFNIMNYDLYINQPYTHHHTPPYDNSQLGYINGSVYGDIQLYLQNGIPADKIVPGCGLYSRRWSGVPNVNNGLFQKGTIDESNLHLTDILARYVNKNGFTRYWDPASQAPYVYNPSSGVFLSYDDQQSVEIKCRIVGEERVRGIMVFDYCTADGIGLYDSMRTWLDKYYVSPCQNGHSYGEWELHTAATFKADGEERRYCTRCNEYESRAIPKLITVTPPSMTVDGNTVSFTEAANIVKAAYGKGSYMTADALIAAGGTALEGDMLSEYIHDGIFSLYFEEPGTYTVIITMSDTRSFTNRVVIEDPAVSVSAEGASVTISNIPEDIKDIFIAKGHFDNYTDVNANKTVRLTSAKINGAKSYSYTLPAGGEHTVLLRTNNGESLFLYVDINVTEPAFSSNGLQLTVSNLEGIKVIRTAYGEYKSGAQIKAAEGSRAFTAKGVLKGVDEYTIQYRENGRVTVAVCYENGYTKIYVTDILQKTPSFTQNDNVVTFGELDGLKVVRYAKGEYTTSAQIKAAPGSVAIKADKVVNGLLSVELKSAGTYTFCVQYDDESYNYYTVTVE